MKESAKKMWPIIAILLLYAVVFNVIAFICANDINPNFWCGYIFIILSWLCVVINVIHTAIESSRGYGERAIFIKAPSILISMIYLIVQLVFGVAVIAIPGFSIKAAVCIQILLLAVYLCIVLALIMYERKLKKSNIR